MKKWTCFVLFVCSLLQGEPLATRVGALLDAHPEARVVEGQDGWHFLANELRHVSRGTEWVAPDTPPDPPHSDPLPALTTLRAQLGEMGIELILVPVPAKAVVHAEALPDGKGDRAEDDPSGLGAFLSHVREQGFQAVDLESLFASVLPDAQVYCKTDSHWSPLGIELAAEAVAEIIRKQSWHADAGKTEIQLREPMDLSFQGDLVGEDGPRETLPLRRAYRTDGGSLLDESSPVLVLGDSHTLVFGEGGDMHSRDGGFVEHLAHALQLPVERIANRGSASTPPRMSVFRKAAAQPEWLENKRVVVYCFTVRELTESLNGWRVLPLSPRFR